MSMPAWEEDEFPSFIHDARRFDVITFGIFPFAWFVASLGFDMARYASNGWNRDYAPWPLKSASGAAYSQDDWKILILSAAGVSVAAGIVDQIIYQVKRSNARKAQQKYDSLTPIIRRKPLDGNYPIGSKMPSDDDDDVTASTSN
jgi:hypothetical protein